MPEGTKKTELILISAMTRDRVIGKDRALPWSIPDEYAHFLRQVEGYPVIMGRTSYTIFGPDLPDSKLVVVSSSLVSLPDADVCPDVEAAVERAGQYSNRVFSAGGATIYRQTLQLADALFLSIVKGDYDGDAYFPEFHEVDWEVVRTEDHPEYEFREYRRSRAAGRS